MSYRVALDSVPNEQGRGDGAMADSWMKASGQNGIPSAFIVNKDGKIAWIGHPMDMDKPLEKIVAGRWDLKTAAEEFRKQRPPTSEELDELARLAKNYKDAKQEDDPEKMITAIDALLGHKADLAEKLGPVKIQLLMKLNRQERAAGIRSHTRARPARRRARRPEHDRLGNRRSGFRYETEGRPPAIRPGHRQEGRRENRAPERRDRRYARHRVLRIGQRAESPRRAATCHRSSRRKRRTRGPGDASSPGKVPKGREPKLGLGPRKMDRQREPTPTTSPPDSLQKGILPRTDAARNSEYGAKKKPPVVEGFDRGRLWWMIPAMTDFRAIGTIMGLAGLTAVFGMGTGVAPPVCSPESRPAGGQAGPGVVSVGRSHTRHSRYSQTNPFGITVRSRASPRGGADGSGWSSCSAVRTGRLRRSRAVHARPIDLVVFQEPSQLMLPETSSRRGLRA